jgi:hypothetical protein
VRYILGFGRFWYDFIVGDDWRIAVLVLGALAIVFALAHHAMNVWWLLPLVVFAALAISLLRETRKRS